MQLLNSSGELLPNILLKKEVCTWDSCGVDPDCRWLPRISQAHTRLKYWEQEIEILILCCQLHTLGKIPNSYYKLTNFLVSSRLSCPSTLLMKFWEINSSMLLPIVKLSIPMEELMISGMMMITSNRFIYIYNIIMHISNI